MRRPSIREGLRNRPSGAHAWRQRLCPRLSLQVARETKSPMGKISTTSPYTSTYQGSRQTGPQRGPIDIIGSAEGRAAYPRGVCLHVHRRSIHWGGPSPCPCETRARIRAGGIHRDGQAAPRSVDHEGGRRTRT